MADALRDEAKLSCVEHLSANLCAYLKILWRSDIIRQAYERRSEFQLMDCANIFLDEIERLGAPDYCPSQSDVLNARTPTLGVNELHYAYRGKEFRNNYENATKYIIRKFEKHHRQKKQNIYSHLTCAKDTDQMQLLTKSLADMVIANLIKQSGISR
ncbi:guanine nucleotide-binding protein subunit alpha-14-like protein [Aphelenchoides avenae]|nr:guanine nucleotide-binding protein subunit alpha-14-like protein [Aphelenchus avenae]